MVDWSLKGVLLPGLSGGVMPIVGELIYRRVSHAIGKRCIFFELVHVPSVSIAIANR